MNQITVAESLVAAFAVEGVERIFGVPGGGSSLDIIQASADQGIDFVLTRTESAAVMMAAATAELTGTLGVALSTKGPGVACAANGLVYALLDRSPVMLLIEGFSPKEESYVTHQVFDQRAMLAPITKGFSRLDGGVTVQEIQGLIDLAMTPPLGPVCVELTGETAQAKVSAADLAAPQPEPTVDETALARAEQFLADAVRPVVIVGLEAREASVAAAIRAFVKGLKCPVLTTYKAKGVVAELDAQYVGTFTGGTAEADCVGQADLILLCGLDPVELIRQPWHFDAPVIDIGSMHHRVHYVTPEVGVYGPIGEHVSRLAGGDQGTNWSAAEIGQFRDRIRSRLRCGSTRSIGPEQVVESAVQEAQSLGRMPRITVDAGAHMFSAMAFWPCAAPNDVLISNGLATMAFALPAAVASALHQPERTVIAFTGDGGLFMCLGELSTAAQQGACVIVVVFNDESLSLIDIKQQQRGLEARGVRWARPDFAQTMIGLGGRGYRVENLEEYQGALKQALHGQGPALIDVVVDPSGYPQQLKAMRG